MVRDGLYNGSQTVTSVDNGDGAQTVTTSYNNPTYNAVTAAISMLAGGTLAGILGSSATSAASAAQSNGFIVGANPAGRGQ